MTYAILHGSCPGIFQRGLLFFPILVNYVGIYSAFVPISSESHGLQDSCFRMASPMNALSLKFSEILETRGAGMQLVPC